MSTSNPDTINDPPDTMTGSANCLAIGTRVAEFEITGIIGEGGFGIVYLALDHSLRRTVALKEYMPGVMAGRDSDQSVVVRSKRHRQAFDTGLRSFINEARMLAQFDHPALIKIHRFWEQNNTGYMAMHYYEGQTLKRILHDNPDFVTEAWLKVILGLILEALEALYKVQILHRDISPENIMIQKDGSAVLLDFGAARQIISDMTQSLTVILKPGYAPIEQYADDPSMLQGPWTDLYSLAAVMYVAVTRTSPPSSVARMIKDPIAPLADGDYPGYSRGFRSAIDQALAVRPENRPQTIAAFRALIGLEKLAPPPPPATRPSARSGQSGDRKTAQEPAPRADSLDPDTQIMTQPTMAAVVAAAPVAAAGRESTSRRSATPATDARMAKSATTAATSGKRRLLFIGLAGVVILAALIGVRGLRKPVPTEPGAMPAASAVAPERPGTEQVVDAETLGWETLNQQINPTALDVTGFIARYPNGKFIDQARSRLTDINRRTPPEVLPITASAADAPATDLEVAATAPVEPLTGTVTLSIKPWGTVTVDGVPKGVSPPLKRLTLTEGKHQIKVVNPNFPDRTVDFTVSKKKTASLTIDFAS
ncbi:MAG: serine/threonine protein kinase [Herminiimonas sp.]|nr:serine/threonine protein kinase [Herminiimonas sp.]